MSLNAGTRLGPYEIQGPLGAGGMGEVYRARDTRLKRDVALKVLPPSVAGDAARQQRFEQEARTVAALNHPNIVAIFDVGEANGVFFIVTELVEGETLRGVNLGLRKTLDCAVQIANGLAAAHGADVVHRDLKPENVLLTRDGRVKILDFGLAKIAPARGLGEFETRTVQTEPGAVLGTVGYMSPEQVKGQPADHRSDIFSFGVILYELLGGARAFQGETAVETMTAILKQDTRELPDTVPSAVRQVVRHCLEKDPGNRFQSARDLSFSLAAMSQSGSQSGATTALATPSRWRRRAFITAAALALMAVAAAATRMLSPVQQASSWSGGLLGGPEMALNPRLSPDGHLLAFQAFDHGFTQVAVMKPETGNWSTLTHSRDHGFIWSSMSWSPDGASIYYDRGTDLPHGIFSVPVLGGVEKLVLENAASPEALPDGTLLVIKRNAQRQIQLFRLWPETGRLQDLPIVFSSFLGTSFLSRASGNGKTVIVQGTAIGREADGPRLLSLDLATGQVKALSNAPALNAGSGGGAVTGDGRSLIMALPAGSLTRVVSVPLDKSSPMQTLFTVTNQVWFLDAAADGSVYATLTDRPVEIVRRSLGGDHSQQVASFPVLGSSSDMMAVLPDGRVIVTMPVSGLNRLMVVETDKSPVSLVTTTEETAAPLAVVGPRTVAFVIGPAPHETIALADTTTGRLVSRISTGKGEIDSLAASPDGRTLYFAANRTIWSVPSQGGEARMVRSGDSVAMDPSGQSLVVTAEESSKLRLFRVFLDGRTEQEIVPDGSAPIMNLPPSPGGLSADGRLLVPLMTSWFNPPATLDTTTGRIARLPSDDVSDYHSMAWLPDGQIMALHIGLRSTLWKFQQVPASR